MSDTKDQAETVVPPVVPDIENSACGEKCSDPCPCPDSKDCKDCPCEPRKEQEVKEPEQENSARDEAESGEKKGCPFMKIHSIPHTENPEGGMDGLMDKLSVLIDKTLQMAPGYDGTESNSPPSMKTPEERLDGLVDKLAVLIDKTLQMAHGYDGTGNNSPSSKETYQTKYQINIHLH